MREVRLSGRAQADLVQIDAYGARRFGDDAADRYSRGLAGVFALLRSYPEAGPARPELGPGIRMFSYESHRVFYRLSHERVLIVRILHRSRHSARALGRP